MSAELARAARLAGLAVVVLAAWIGTAPALAGGVAAGGAVVLDSSATRPVPDGRGGHVELPVASPVLASAVSGLSGKARVEVVGTPRLLATVGERAEIVLGRPPVFPPGTIICGGGVPHGDAPDFRLSTGITTHRTGEDLLRLDIARTLEGFARDDGGESSAASAPQARDERELSVTVREGEWVVVPGPTRERVRTEVAELPYLADLPWVGSWFRFERERIETVGLVTVLRPQLIRSAVDLDRIVNRPREQPGDE